MMWLKQWKSDIKELEAQVRAIKRKLRQNWSAYCQKTWYMKDHDPKCRNHPGYDQDALIQLKWQLTCMYEYRRQHKGKKHVEFLNPVASWLKTVDLSKYDKMKEDEKALQTIVDLACVVPQG